MVTLTQYILYELDSDKKEREEMAKQKLKKAKKPMSHKREEKLEEKVSPGIHKKIRKLEKKSKVSKVMHEYKEGKLHSGSKKGPEVTNPKQAMAIALSEARRVGEPIKKKKKRK